MENRSSQHTNALENENRLFPVFLKLENLRLLVVGGGNVGLEKLAAVLANAPHTRVTVVAEDVSIDVTKLANRFPTVQLIEKAFEESDLEEKDVVIVAINDKSTSSVIRQLARQRNLLVNVADTPELCDFYLGSIVQKGSIKIAISTNGQSPTLAKRLKEVLNEALPSNLHQLAQNLNQIRKNLKGQFTEKVKRLNELTSGLVSQKKE